MNKKHLYFIGILVILILCCFFIWKHFENRESIITDAEKFSSEYTEVDENNVFKYAKMEEILNVLEKGTGVVYLGFPECGWCQAYVKYLNEVAKENEFGTIFYYNIKEDRANNTENYKKIVSLLNENLMNDDEGNKRIFVPNVTFVKNGQIIANDNETSVVTEEDGTPLDYWTDEKVQNLKTKLDSYFKKIEQTVCTNCN